ncbi:MAG: hypothetical protein LC128_02255 [Chitinophagales bacterium]|nr:hypothetical protein [Chitinophagales bacterium]
MAIISIITLIFPVVLVLVLQLYRSKCFLALAIYYLLDFCFNVMSEGYIPVNENFRRAFGITTNLLEFPLMFIFISYFSPSLKFAKKIRISVVAILLFELIIVLAFGFNRTSMTIIMAPEISLLLFFSVWFSLRYIKIAIIQGKTIGKALMITSLLFAYGSYAIIYVFFYVLDSKELNDIFTMYYFSTVISTLMLSSGILIENKRIKKLLELRRTRKELKLIYDDSQPVTTVSFKQ